MSALAQYTIFVKILLLDILNIFEDTFHPTLKLYFFDIFPPSRNSWADLVTSVSYTECRWNLRFQSFLFTKVIQRFLSLHQQEKNWGWYFVRIIWFTVDCTAFVYHFSKKLLKSKVLLNRLIDFFTLNQ